MEKRKDSVAKGSKLPKEYLKLVSDLFNKNFKKELLKKELFLVFGEIYPDEVLLAVSLKHDGLLDMTTCYASVDYPPKAVRADAPQKSVDAIKDSMNLCVDAIASFFQTFFSDGRPVDYENEYRQGWVPVEIEKGKPVYMKINRDNTELDAQADEILAQDERNKLH